MNEAQRTNRGTLKDQGYRFVKRGDEFKWVHPAELKGTDHDCTDMNDAEFYAFVMDGGAS